MKKEIHLTSPQLPGANNSMLRRHTSDLRFSSLRKQLSKISEVLTNELQACLSDAEFSVNFDRKGSCLRGVVIENLHQPFSAMRLERRKSATC
jgi:hypothetical protein